MAEAAGVGFGMNHFAAAVFGDGVDGVRDVTHPRLLCIIRQIIRREDAESFVSICESSIYDGVCMCMCSCECIQGQERLGFRPCRHTKRRKRRYRVKKGGKEQPSYEMMAMRGCVTPVGLSLRQNRIERRQQHWLPNLILSIHAVRVCFVLVPLVRRSHGKKRGGQQQPGSSAMFENDRFALLPASPVMLLPDFAWSHQPLSCPLMNGQGNASKANGIA